MAAPSMPPSTPPGGTPDPGASGGTGSGIGTAGAPARRRTLASWRSATTDAEAVAALMVRLAQPAILRVHVDGTLHRAVFDRNLRRFDPPQPLYYLNSLGGGRYSPIGGPAGLYLAYDAATPAAEVRAVIFNEAGFPAPSTPHDPVVTFAATVNARGLLDLTDAMTRRALDLRVGDLHVDWLAAQEAAKRGDGLLPITQQLALAAHGLLIFGGIKYPSVRARFGTNVVLFPDRLDASAGDQVALIDSTGYYQGRLP
jgi:hypothetical protein